MGRKGVSKRKKAKEKGTPAAGSNTIASLRTVVRQPEQVTDKDKPAGKTDKKR